MSDIIKFMFNNKLERVYDTPIPIHFFGSSSKGNSVFFKKFNLLIDLGFPYKKYEEYEKDFFKNIDTIIITHEHSDHFNPSTLLRVIKEFPNIKIYMTDFMYDEILKPEFKATYKKIPTSIHHPSYGFKKEINSDEIIKSPYMNRLNKIKHKITSINSEKDEKINIFLPNRQNVDVRFYPHIVKHGNIINLAIVLLDWTNEKSILYTSDLDNLKGETSFVDKNGKLRHISGLPQDYIFDMLLLEANHDIKIIKEWSNLHDDYASKARIRGSLKHISEQESFEYVRKHLSNDGIFIPLHASETFGTLIQKTL